MGTSTLERAILGISPDDASASSCKQTSTDKGVQGADKVCEVINLYTRDNINTHSTHTHKHCISTETSAYGLFGDLNT